MGKRCERCFRDVVHPDRKYCLCLDCLIDMLREQGFELPSRYREKYRERRGEVERIRWRE